MMMQNTTNNAGPCIVCGSQATVQILESYQVPVLCNVLWTTREAAVGVPRAKMRLTYCRDCGHVFNASFDPLALEYTETYENSLDFSPVFRYYARSLATDLIERFELHNKCIVEVGSGKGDFLRLLCEMGDNQGVGFDPSYAPDTESGSTNERVDFIQDIYSDEYIDCSPDLICCRHTLEHLSSPTELVRMVHRAASQNGAAVFFEVPNVLYTLRDLGIWDLIYEHCSYFSACSLTHLFQASGFHVENVTATYENQFLCIDAFHHDETDEADSWNCTEHEELDKLALNFESRYRNKIAMFQEQLRGIRAIGQRAVLWGAGSKGVTFLNLLHNSVEIERVVDINPRKQGMYVSGTGQPIVAPEHLLQYRPDVVIIMNSIYRREISRRLDGLGVDARILLA